jgi:hypothetical protein
MRDMRNTVTTLDLRTAICDPLSFSNFDSISMQMY